jgi:anti-sigma B factor antagonist
MSTNPTRPILEVEQVGPVVVARMPRGDLLDETAIQAVGTQLMALVDVLGCQRVLLDFRNVRRVASSLLGKVIALHNRLKAAGGKLAVCGTDPIVGGVFQIMALDRLFGIYPEEQEALQSLQ